MSMVLAPYNDAMRIGQGFNSYTHELCIDGAVLVKTEKGADEQQTKEIPSPAQVVSYSARVVEKLSDVVESMNISYCSSIKKGTVAVNNSSSTIDETSFKSADLNIVVTVKVTNQTTIIKDNAMFQEIKGIEPGSTLFNQSYGDSYISGFIQGGEFTGIISLKVIDRSKVESTINVIKSGLDAKDNNEAPEFTLSTYGKNSSNDFSSAIKNTESHVSVSWMGGGQIKDETTLWDVDSVFAAAAAFPKRVSERPQRTWAILTKYKSNRSFIDWSHKKLFKTLEYDQVSSYTAELFESYMDYKLLLKDLQRIMDDRDSYQAPLRVENPLDTEMETLLSVRSAMRQEQTKIIEAINVLSRDPGILKRQMKWPAGRRCKVVSDIISKALGPEIEAAENQRRLDEQFSQLAPPNLDQTEGTHTPATSEYEVVRPSTVAPQLDFNFATLVPAEVWRNVMPVPKPNVVPIIPLPSIGMQAQLGLSGFISTGPPSDDANWAKRQVTVTQSYEEMKRELEMQRAEVDILRNDCNARIAQAEAMAIAKVQQAEATAARLATQLQQAEASRNNDNAIMTAESKAKDDSVRTAQNAQFAAEKQAAELQTTLQTRTVERDTMQREKDEIIRKEAEAIRERDAAIRDRDATAQKLAACQSEASRQKDANAQELAACQSDAARLRNDLNQKILTCENDKKAVEMRLGQANSQLIPNENADLHIFEIIYGQKTDYVNHMGVRNSCYNEYRSGNRFLVNNAFFDNADDDDVQMSDWRRRATFVYRLRRSGNIRKKTVLEHDYMVFD